VTEKKKNEPKMTADEQAYFRAQRLGIPYYDRGPQESGSQTSKRGNERVDKSSLAPYELKAQKFDKSMRGGGGGGGRGSRQMQLGADLDPKAMMQRMNEDYDDSYKKGGKVSSASKRADGIAQRGKTKGRMV
jgi:hypothetical protein